MIQMKSKILFFILLLSSFTLATAQETVTFEASGPSQAILDRPFQIKYTISGKPKDFRAPEFIDFDILSGPNQSVFSERRNINGQRTSTTTYTYTYTLMAKRTGKFTIPSASITVNNERYTSKGLSIEVLPANSTPQQPSQQQGAQQATPSNTPSSSGNEVSNENLFIRTLISKRNVYEQEAISLTYRLYSSLDLVNFAAKKMPDFKGFIINDITFQPEVKLESYNGRTYAVVDLYQTILFPQRSGDIDIDPAEFEIIIRVQNPNSGRSIFDSFFDSYTNVSRNVTAPGTKIKVTELPPNKPMSFNGTVGSFRLNSSVSTQEVKVNEAITMSITIQGSGSMRMIKTPEIKLPNSFEAYDPEVSNNFQTTEAGVSGSKTVKYLFIPRHAGNFEIPSVEFSYFDLASKSYKTLRTPPYTINVLKADGEEASTPVIDNYTEKESVKQLGSDIRYIHSQDVKLSFEERPVIGSLTSWLMYLIPVCIALLMFFILSKQARENANAKLVKNKKANKIARKRLNYAQKLLSEGKKDQFYDELLKATWTYLSDKLSIPMAGLNKDNVVTELQKHKVDDALTGQLLNILNTGEFARYAPGSGKEEMGNLFDETIQVISNLEEKIKI